MLTEPKFVKRPFVTTVGRRFGQSIYEREAIGAAATNAHFVPTTDLGALRIEGPVPDPLALGGPKPERRRSDLENAILSSNLAGAKHSQSRRTSMMSPDGAWHIAPPKPALR